jgi:cytochrome c oxidase cbb3-type subunit 2
MAGDLYNKPILFAIVAAAVVLIGTAVTMFIPMLTEEMHPKLSTLKPYTALQLAGKDIYQREGCNNCHTQTVRPLKTEVMRYGEYSKAGNSLTTGHSSGIEANGSGSGAHRRQISG